MKLCWSDVRVCFVWYRSFQFRAVIGEKYMLQCPHISHSETTLMRRREVSSSYFEDLTHWGRATHICVSKLTIIGSDNGLSPGRRQAIIWTNAGILSIGPLGTIFSEIVIGIHTFSFGKMHLKMSSAKWWPFCLGPNVLNISTCWKAPGDNGSTRYCFTAYSRSNRLFLIKEWFIWVLNDFHWIYFVRNTCNAVYVWCCKRSLSN